MHGAVIMATADVEFYLHPHALDKIFVDEANPLSEQTSSQLPLKS